MYIKAYIVSVSIYHMELALDLVSARTSNALQLASRFLAIDEFQIMLPCIGYETETAMLQKGTAREPLETKFSSRV